MNLKLIKWKSPVGQVDGPEVLQAADNSYIRHSDRPQDVVFMSKKEWEVFKENVKNGVYD